MNRPSFKHSHTNNKYQPMQNLNLFSCEVCGKKDVVELMTGNYKTGVRLQWCASGHIAIIVNGEIALAYNIKGKQVTLSDNETIV